ncbi:hypothetical protein GQ44DRAFT_764962 [Phaeosphaeriaceae sp. PMI808]|nr:hypothetical protein GQ44DRAFT_764962 [Phaeosphaeriaceae sp. PMI808]
MTLESDFDIYVHAMLQGCLHKHAYTNNQLECYLNRALAASSFKEPTTVKNFVSQFCDACQKYVGEQSLGKEEAIKVWVFTSEISIVRKIPNKVQNLSNLIIDVIEDYNAFDDVTRCNKIPPSEMEEIKTCVNEAKTSWEKAGSKKDLLPKLLVEDIIRSTPYHSRSKIFKMVNIILNKSSIVLPVTVDSDEGYKDYRMISGELPNRRKVQPILLHPKRGSPLETVLRFYASHVMSFISGTIAAHLYYSMAMDFREDKRQALATKAIKKWKDRGWFFTMFNYERGRCAADQRSKVINFEKFYISALEAVGRKDDDLPEWWPTYFGKIYEELETYTWMEVNRKIVKLRYSSFESSVNF